MKLFFFFLNWCYIFNANVKLCAICHRHLFPALRHVPLFALPRVRLQLVFAINLQRCIWCAEREREKKEGQHPNSKFPHLALKCLDNYLHFEILFSVIPTENLSLIGLIHTVQDLSRVVAIKPITFQLTGCVLTSLWCMTTAVPVSAAVHQRFSANQHILKFECLSFLNINRKLYHLATS